MDKYIDNNEDWLKSVEYLSNEQIDWFKKLYFNGLGEFFYRNNIDVSFDNFDTFLIKY